MRDVVRVIGHVRVIEWDARTGRLLSDWRGKNIVTDLGRDLIAERLRGNTAVSGIAFYALGTDSTPPVAANTALGNEQYRAMITSSRVSAGELILTLHLGATQGNGQDYVEGAAFNGENIMLCRYIGPPKAKTNLKELTVIHTIPFVL